jgi:DNA-binding MarR family transcriptional regulator
METTKQYIEDMALVFESFGVPRMASRVWAQLWVTPEPHLAPAQLEEQLAASTGAVSTALRYLLDLGIIDRVRVEGERRAYYRASTAAMERLFLRRTAGARELIRLADRGLAEFGDAPETRARLVDMREFYAWFLAEMEDLAERWQTEKNRKQVTT